VLFSPVYTESHPRRPLASFLGLTVTSRSPFSLLLHTDHCSLITAHYSRKSLPHNPFADHHPLTPVVSILYKNIGRCRQTPGPKSLLSRPPFALLTLLAATLTELPASVANKRLTDLAKPFSCNTYKKHGGGCELQFLVPN